MKRRKLSLKQYQQIALKLSVANELRKDSIAHLIKEYFTLDNIHNRELFKYDNEKGKLLVSKKCLNYLLNISQCQLLEKPLDFEFVDEIKILKGE